MKIITSYLPQVINVNIWIFFLPNGLNEDARNSEVTVVLKPLHCSQICFLDGLSYSYVKIGRLWPNEAV